MMNVRYTLALILSLLSLLGCRRESIVEIEAVCERDEIGNYIIKWETTPTLIGTMKLYVSDTPTTFNTSRPSNYTDINEGKTVFITQDNSSRKYFLLSFNDRYFKTVGARVIVMDSVVNLRDIGGYPTRAERYETQWGKVFRSGSLHNLSERDRIRLDRLHLKTIIDLRDTSEINDSPDHYKGLPIVYTPVKIKNKELVLERLKERKMRKGDGLLYMQDTYLHFIDDEGHSFSDALHLFLDRSNYPILIHSAFGKDRTGFLTALLLAALGVPEDVIIDDYLASNNHIHRSRVASIGWDLDLDTQETITLIMSADESWLKLAFDQIRKEYGSIDKYLTKKIGLTEKEQKRLQEILLH